MMKSRHTIIDEIPYLDINELSKIGALDGGAHIYPNVSLKYPFLCQLRTYRYRADMMMRHCTTWKLFRIEWTPCTFGGKRPWFICTCDKRVGKIYGGGIFLGCRHCYEGRYRTQKLGKTSRKFRRACEIRLSLGGEPAIRRPFPERPRGMWRKKYDRLRLECEMIEWELKGSQFSRLAPDYTQFSFC